MTNTERAFAELTFSAADKSYFDGLVTSLVPAEKLYDSPVMPHIRGNMTAVLHCTLFFGLTALDRNNDELLQLLKSFDQTEIALGELFFIEGYQSLYRVLCIQVLDLDHKLFKLSQAISKFAPVADFGQREFKPHLTLAYVTSDYELPTNLPAVKTKLAIDEIKVSLVSDFNQAIANKEAN